MKNHSNKKQIFDIWANSYDFIFPSILYQATHKKIIEYIELSSYSNVLDIGCGTGQLLKRLANNYLDMKGIGLDFSSQMLFYARRMNRHNSRLLFVQGNAYPLNFMSDYFSDIFNTFSFLHYDNPYFFFKEVYRTLIPGGTFYLVDPILCESTNEMRLPITPGGISLYSPKKRESIGFEAGFSSVEHFPLLGSVKLSVFKKPK